MMKLYKLITILLAGIILSAGHAVAQSSEGKTAQKLLDAVVGTWKLGTHSTTGKEIESQQAHIGETLEFTREAKFISRNSKQTLDSGYYRMNENQKKLYLESVKAHTPVEWNIRLKNNTLTLFKDGDEGKKNLQYIYLREAAEATK